MHLILEPEFQSAWFCRLLLSKACSRNNVFREFEARQPRKIILFRMPQRVALPLPCSLASVFPSRSPNRRGVDVLASPAVLKRESYSALATCRIFCLGFLS